MAGTPISDDLVAAAATAAGVDDPKLILDDASWDEAVRASHDLAFGAAGPDIGSPVLLIEDAPRGVHGPIPAEVPDPAEALAIWDAVLPLARSGVFVELKRGRS
jgi:hypothetical protein